MVRSAHHDQTKASKRNGSEALELAHETVLSGSGELFFYPDSGDTISSVTLHKQTQHSLASAQKSPGTEDCPEKY